MVPSMQCPAFYTATEHIVPPLKESFDYHCSTHLAKNWPALGSQAVDTLLLADSPALPRLPM